MEAWLLTGVSIFAVWAFAKKGFSTIGWLCCAISFVILSYYAVVGGWIIEYIWQSLTGTFATLEGETTMEVAKRSTETFGAFIANPWRVLTGYLIFMFLTAGVILGGIQKGIERVSKVLMPALFVLLLVVIVRSVTLPGAWEGVVFLLKPTTEAFTPKVIMMAMGQAFFSLSLGMAITVTYGSYLNREQSILSAAGWVGILDTIAALLAGLAIFPAVFSAGLEPSAGPGLIFGALPATFAAMPLSSVWATCFFFMLLIAAVTSSASLLECTATTLIERVRKGHKRCSRRFAVISSLIACTLLGCLTVFSTVDWSYIPCVERGMRIGFGSLTQGNWFDTIDNFASNWGLPFTALAIAILVGWIYGTKRAKPGLLPCDPMLRKAPNWLLNAWGFSIRWVGPVAILFVFLTMSGLLKL
jgi:NSS family neurotransmitter:Na+ symporter